MDERRNQQQGRQSQQSRQPQQSQNDLRQPQQSQQNVSPLGDSSAARSSGQQGSDLGRSRQPQQFEQGSGQQSGGGGSTSRFADQVREHMEVVDDAGQHVGTVDHVDGDRIKLARSDSSDGQHHYVMLSQVAGIEGDKLRLRERGDNDYGQEAGS